MLRVGRKNNLNPFFAVDAHGGVISDFHAGVAVAVSSLILILLEHFRCPLVVGTVHVAGLVVGCKVDMLPALGIAEIYRIAF